VPSLSRSSDAWRGRLWLALALGGLLVVLVRNAWMCDDAYITFRVVDNLASGYGPRWNVAERVQGYTHPLWMALCTVAYFVTREIYYTVTLLSLVLSLLCAAALARLAPDRGTALVGITTLALSKPWVDYSTSGLENPLTYALLAVFLVYLFQRTTTEDSTLGSGIGLGLLGSALILSRPDLALLVLPALAARGGWPPRPRQVVALGVGLLPVVAWTAFSLFYYGAPVPNTAYAKLNTGLSAADLLPQGLLYVADLVKRSPLTAGVILAGTLVGFTRRRTAPLALGALLYLIYVVRIGGDFMSGRFFTAPFVVALALLLRRGLPGSRTGRLLTVATVLLLGIAWPRSPLWSGAGYGRADPDRPEMENGIADERAVYYQQTGLLPALTREGPPLAHRWAAAGRSARAAGPSVLRRMGTGFFGFYAGPRVHIVDGHALTDPLLARLPANTRRGYRIGHFRRVSPRGYEESLRTGRNQIADPDLAAYWDRLRLVTRGPLLDGERLRTVVELNLGRYDGLLLSWEERRDRARERRLKKRRLPGPASRW
jgi:arabinofuranosyltransferase